MSQIGWIPVAVGFLAGVGLTPLALTYSRSRGLIDLPGPRRSHLEPVARGGGVAVAVAFLLGGMTLPGVVPGFAAMAVGVIGFALIGWIDDHRPLPVLLRLVTELLMTALLLGWIWPEEWSWMLLVAAVFAVVWWVNLFNFMDGSDGLATSQSCFMAIAFAGMFFVAGFAAWATLALTLAAAALAFLGWNRPPAKIFLGDAGSLMLGWALAFLGLVALREDVVNPSLCLILAAPFLVDASLTLAWRVLRGQQWYTPHREHAYQILIRCGWSHGGVLAGLFLVNILLIAPAAGIALMRPEYGILVAALVLAILTGVWSIVRFRLARGRLNG